MSLPPSDAGYLAIEAYCMVFNGLASGLSPIKKLQAQAAIIFTYLLWNTRTSTPFSDPPAHVGTLLDQFDRSLAVRLLQQFGVHTHGLTCINAVMWVLASRNGLLTPPPVQATHDVPHECCRCGKKSRSKVTELSPFLWHTLQLVVPVCVTCALTLEHWMPLYAQPAPRWCSACGRGGRELNSLGQGCFICTGCQLLAVSHRQHS